MTQKTYELVLRLLSPDPKIRELAADEFNDRGWNQDDELLLGRVLVRAALAENVPRCLEAQLNALGGNERGSIGLPPFDHSVELAELIDRLDAEDCPDWLTEHLEWLNELVSHQEGRPG